MGRGRGCGYVRWPIGTKQKHKTQNSQNRITKPKTESQNPKQKHKTQTESQNPKQKHKTQNRIQTQTADCGLQTADQG